MNQRNIPTDAPFIYIPVPSEHAVEVIQYVAGLVSEDEGGASASHPAPPSSGSPSGDATGDPWTDAELQRLLEMQSKTAQFLGQILSFLAERPGEDHAVSTRELAGALGVNYHKMKAHPTQMRRTLGRHFPGYGTPWSAKPGPRFHPPRVDELFFWIDTDRAEQVKRILS